MGILRGWQGRELTPLENNFRSVSHIYQHTLYVPKLFNE